MVGLLGNIGAALGGLLGSPRAKDALLLSIASGGDPRFAAGLMGQRNEMQRANKQDELYQLQMDEARRKAAEARLAQQRQATTQGLLTTLNIPEVRAAYSTPEMQAVLRPYAVANADPAALEQAGVLAPLPEAQKLPKEAMLYQMSQQDPKFAEWLRSQQAASGSEGQYFSGVTVRMPDGSYAVVQPGNKPGMGLNTVPLPGAPVTYDSELAAALAAARAAGTASGEAQGAAPGKVASIDDALAAVDEVKGDPNLKNAYGVIEGRSPTIRQGTADFEAKRDRLVESISLAERGELKGTGPITDFEQKMLRTAKTILMNPLISEQAAQAEVARVEQWLLSKRNKLTTISPNSSPSQQTKPRLKYNPATGAFE